MAYIALFSGIVLLFIAGDILVRGSVALAVRFNISALIIGLTIVAFGTSLPELLVSVRSATGGHPGIALGNVIGSNIANILLVLGVPAVIAPINCFQPFIRINTSFLIAATVIFIALCQMTPLTFLHGLILSAMMALFLFDCFWRAKRCQSDADIVGEEASELIDDAQSEEQSISKIWIFIIAGLVGLPIGAELTIFGGVEVARLFNISEAAIGLTLVAVGTSLPELAATVMAAFRGQCGLALGNAIGSNLFNILAVMGITALITEVPVSQNFLDFDLWFMLATSLIIVPLAFGGLKINRILGLAFLVSYCIYTFMVVDQGKQQTEAYLFHLQLSETSQTVS